jgi:two-component system chemotaxis response regulator CheY
LAYSFGNLNILLIEDDWSMRALVRDVLQAFGAGTVQTASDGSAAYQILRNFPADIIILDWLMEPMNGLEFLKLIRNASDTPNPYVAAIMLTAFTELERVKECRDAGITEFLAKPFTPQKLYGRIARVIEDQRLYVRSETYFGPDRRRADRPFPGPDRRATGTEVDLDAASWTMSATSATEAAGRHVTR